MNTMINTVTREKVRAGQPYLYRANGLPSEVYEVRFKEHIEHDALDLALQQTIERYPYFKVRYQEQNGDFFTEPNDLPVAAYETEELPALGGADNNYYLIAVSHWNEHMYVSFHHGLTDGRGIKSFVETLVYYYCAEVYGSTDVPAGVLTLDTPMSDDETAEPCCTKYKVESKEKIEGISRKGFTLPETKGSKAAHRRYELRFPQDEFIAMCKSYGGSPVTMLSVMMSRAIHELYPESSEVINSNFPVDVRRELGVGSTYKNCVKSVSLPYGEAEQTMSTAELCAHYKSLLNAQRAPDHCKAEFNNIIMLLNVINLFKSYKGKRRIMTFLDDLKLDTYLISYIGQFSFGANERYIDSVHLFSDCSDGLVMNMTCACGYFSIDFVQDFEGEHYVNALVKQFERESVSLSVSDAVMFSTPCDRLMSNMPYTEEQLAANRTVWQKTVDANVTAYRAVENITVSTMTAISDGFVKLFLMRKDETLEQAKQRLNDEKIAHLERQLAVLKQS